MQTAVGAPSPGTPAVQSAASDHAPLTGALQLSAHVAEATLADATLADATLADAMTVAVGAARVPRVRVPINRRRQRVMRSFHGATARPPERGPSVTEPPVLGIRRTISSPTSGFVTTMTGSPAKSEA